MYTSSSLRSCRVCLCRSIHKSAKLLEIFKQQKRRPGRTTTTTQTKEIREKDMSGLMGFDNLPYAGFFA
jgi:hypothetical protein